MYNSEAAQIIIIINWRLQLLQFSYGNRNWEVQEKEKKSYQLKELNL